MKYLFLLCYYMILARATIFEEAFQLVLDKNAFLEDLAELKRESENGLIPDAPNAINQLLKEHIFATERQNYYRMERVKAFMRECGIKPKQNYSHHHLEGLPDVNLYPWRDMQILMFLLQIDCSYYKDFFFTSKGDLLHPDIIEYTQVFRDLWELLDHYGIEYNQRGPKFNSQTLGVTVSHKGGKLHVSDIFIAEDKKKDDELIVKSINSPHYGRFYTKLFTHLPDARNIIKEHRSEIYISASCCDRYIGTSNSTSLMWGLHAAIHNLPTPATVFTGAIDRNSGKIEPIGGMDAKHAAAESFDLPMIVPEQNVYTRNARYSNAKATRSWQEAFSIASKMPLLDKDRLIGIHANKPGLTTKPTPILRKLLHKLPRIAKFL